MGQLTEPIQEQQDSQIVNKSPKLAPQEQVEKLEGGSLEGMTTQP